MTYSTSTAVQFELRQANPMVQHKDDSWTRRVNLPGNATVLEFVSLMRQAAQKRPHRYLQAADRSANGRRPNVYFHYRGKTKLKSHSR